MAKASLDWRPFVRYGVLFVVLLLAVSGLIYASQQAEQFLIRDARFALPGPPDYGLESPNLELRGVHYASRQAVLNTFGRDFSRSTYLLPLADRRKALLRLGWVKDATIQRLWPNRVVVTISERQPAAFLDVKVEGMSRWSLIDSDGVILEAPARATFKLPVVTGISAAETSAQRGVRVRRMQRMMKDLGSLESGVSEVDVRDLDDLKLTESLQGHAVTLMMGDRNFAPRLRNFLEHYPEIARKMPAAHGFDLRLDDRITVLEDKGAF